LLHGAGRCYLDVASGFRDAMLRRLYDWTMGLAARRNAIWVLALVAFAESSVFPIPPDLLLVPMVLAARASAFRIAAVATAASVAGGLAGYGIGALLFETLGRPIIDFYGVADEFTAFQEAYRQWGAWIVAGAGFTPFPYKVITIASGVAGLDLWTFMIASAVSRGARFYLEAWLLWRYGPPIRGFIEGNLAWLSVIFFLLLVGGFVVAKYVL
jgi:membrane protein YqaA with SNARE-associated domain